MRYTIETLTPVHVGSGDELGRLDYLWRGGKLFVLHLDRLLAQPGVSAEELSEFLAEPGFSLAHYVQERQIPLDALAKYTADCAVDPRGSAVREQIKDIYHRPYIPGSSLKGAIRTAVLWSALQRDDYLDSTEDYLHLALRRGELQQAFKAQNAWRDPHRQRRIVASVMAVSGAQAERYLHLLYEVLDIQEGKLGRPSEQRKLNRGLSRLGSDRRYLSQPIEQMILGRDPNRDLLRALQVSDAAPHASEDLEVRLVETYSLDREGRLRPSERLRTFGELLKVGATTEATIKIDEGLFAYEELGFAGKRDWLELSSVCNEYTGRLMEAEEAFYRDHKLAEVASSYRELRQELKNVGERAFLLPIGWGAGWETKTVARLLREDDPALFSDLREKFRLGKMGYDVFPKTRRLVDGAQPLGWVKLTPT